MTKEGKLTGQLVSDETKKDLAHAFYDFQPAVDIKVEYVAVDENHKAIVCSVGRRLSILKAQEDGLRLG